MDDTVIAAMKPCLVKLKKARRYMWCTCGKSAQQPFCDGSHKGTDFTPLAFTVQEDRDALLCACKHTKMGPFCDGSHNDLSETYGEDGGNVMTHARLVPLEADVHGAQYARLDNHCFVIRPHAAARYDFGPLMMHQTIAPCDGANQLSQFLGKLSGEGPVLSFGDSDAVLFVLSGSGHIDIGPRRFPLPLQSGAFIKAGEAFKLSPETGQQLVFNITVCPLGPEPNVLPNMPNIFDDNIPTRVEIMDAGKRSGMADRFYQVLIDGEKQGTEVTQFIGHIPKSRAPHHKHIYEETITILSGEGYMWTDDTKSEVREGDTIFLPLKQSHSLEAINTEGMLIVGVFFPAMSPAINY